VSRPLLAAMALVFTATPLSGCAFEAAANDEPAAPLSIAAPDPSPVPATSVAPAGSWALAPDQSAAVNRAGLPMFGHEVTTVHYHAHLDLLIRGEPVLVPAFVGVDHLNGTMSPLHSHDTTGIVHIESPQDTVYTLGQFFTEWGIVLSSSQIGPVTLADDEQLRVYRNGKLVNGDPAAVGFTAYAEYFIWVGLASSPPSKPPAKYTFPKGL
jgi:hypothetical protein